MKLSKISREDIRKARKAGFKKKALKKPKASASLGVIENYISRQNDWIKEAKARIQQSKKLDSARKQLKGY